MNVKLKVITSYGMKVLTVFLSLIVVTQSVYADELSLCENNNINFKAYFEGGGKPALDWSTFVNSRSMYEKFVVELVNHVKATLSNEAACDIYAPDPVKISLTFVERHFSVYENERERYKNKSELTLKIDPSAINNFSCQLSSPWLDMTIQRSPSFEVVAVFNFEDRQFLIDQALLTYPHLAATFKRQPLTDDLYDRSEKEYYTLFNRFNSNSSTVPRPSPETAKYIPIDLLWLFNHTLKDRAGIYEIHRLVQARYLEYAEVVKALVSHCFASEESHNFKTINELKPFYGAEALNDYKNKSHYRIDKGRN